MSARTLDERGRACPLPVIALGRALRSEAPRTLITLIADDPVVRTDVPAWCALVGATLVSMSDGEGGITAVIRLP